MEDYINYFMIGSGIFMVAGLISYLVWDEKAEKDSYRQERK